MATSIINVDELMEKVLRKIRSYSPNINIDRLKRAYEFAKQAHGNQIRKSGKPYLIHPVQTVQILTNLHVDENTLIAALLHDVPEDTPSTVSDVKKIFGEKVAYLVDGITKLSKVYYREQMEQRHIESLKKLFIHSAEDLRVILIKLADRLDNMRTLKFITDEKKRTRIARETLEIYVPISNLLGIGEIRAELEDLCFEHLHPLEFSKLKKEVEENTEEREFILEEMIHLTEKELQKYNIEAEIIGRPKTLYSIFKKLQTKQNLYNIDDLIAIRIIVPSRKDCYETLGIIHRLFRPKPYRVKDYIAVPKTNGYQSLHTTVFGINSNLVEYQIRTRYMHLEAEYGVAAHYFYKNVSEQELTASLQQRSSWVQRILEIQKDHPDAIHFVEDLKLDVFQDRIFVFTPKGDVIDLPRGATVLDFAYAIHTDIGNHAIQAEINSVLSPITSHLTNGDTVRIVMDKEASPEREWLNFVKTTLAANRIKAFLKSEPLDKKIASGKRVLQKEFDRVGKDCAEELTAKRVLILSKNLPYKTLNAIFTAIGEGSLPPNDILKILYEEKQLKPERLFGYKIQKSSTKKKGFVSRVGLEITGKNNESQFKEIIRTLNSLKIPIVKFIIDRPWILGKDRCQVSILIKNYSELSLVFESLEQLPGVEKISRLFLRRKIIFSIYTALVCLFWLNHPFLMKVLIDQWPSVKGIPEFIMYGGIAMLFGLIFHLKRLARRSFPELAETNFYWPFLYALNTLALVTVFWEVIRLNMHLHWIFLFGLIVGAYALLTASYVNYKRSQT